MFCISNNTRCVNSEQLIGTTSDSLSPPIKLAKPISPRWVDGAIWRHRRQVWMPWWGSIWYFQWTVNPTHKSQNVAPLKVAIFLGLISQQACALRINDNSQSMGGHIPDPQNWTRLKTSICRAVLAWLIIALTFYKLQNLYAFIPSTHAMLHVATTWSCFAALAALLVCTYILLSQKSA